MERDFTIILGHFGVRFLWYIFGTPISGLKNYMSSPYHNLLVGVGGGVYKPKQFLWYFFLIFDFLYGKIEPERWK